MSELSKVDRLLQNLNGLHEIGRQRAFELGNPYYGHRKGDGDSYRKELPSGEIYLVNVEVVMDNNDMPVEIKDTIIKRLKR